MGGRRPELRFWLSVLILAGCLYLIVGLQVTAFYLQYGQELQFLPAGLRRNLLVFLAVALATLIPFLVLGMRMWFLRYVLPVHRITEDVEALLTGTTTARPAHPDEDPVGLASLLHDLMGRYERAEVDLEDRLRQAHGELIEEKTRLESLLNALSEGVVACTMDGRVTHYNVAARRMLGEVLPLGVDRPITELVDQAVFDHAMALLPGQIGKGVSQPFISFVFDREKTGQPYEARLAPLLVYGGRLEGLVLTVIPGENGIALPGWMRPRVSESASLANGTLPDDLEQRPLGELRYVVFDTETTGLDPSAGDEIISLAAIRVENGEVLEHDIFDCLVNPQRPVRAAAQRVHGISSEALRDQPTIGEVLPEFLRFAQGAVLVAHHAAFDLKFLQRHAEGSGLGVDQPVLDTMLLSAALHPNQPSQSLDSLIARYGLVANGRHTALGDARITAELLLRLLPLLERRSILTLGQALAASRRTPLARLHYR